MNKYIVPELDIVEFEQKDILTASGDELPFAPFPIDSDEE